MGSECPTGRLCLDRYNRHAPAGVGDQSIQWVIIMAPDPPTPPDFPHILV